MNELKAKLAALGIPEDKIDPALQTVGDYLKTKVPVQYQAMVDQALAGQTPELGGALDKIKGMFGR